MNVIGEVDGRTCLIVDDMIDTGGTLVRGARALKEKGAEKVYACCVHGVFAGDAVAQDLRFGSGAGGDHQLYPALSECAAVFAGGGAECR